MTTRDLRLRCVACARLVVWLATAASSVATAATAAALTPLQREDIEQVIHDYLLKHPEVVTNALQAASAYEQQRQGATARAAVAANRAELFNDPATPVGGNPKGDASLVEFFDYRCPYCKQIEPAIEGLLKEDPKLRIVYKEFPILGPASELASHVALAALKQGRYEPFHTAMMAAKGQITEDVIFRVAAAAQLDMAKLMVDMRAPEFDVIIQRNLALATALGVNGTPAFVIGDRLIEGVVDLATLRQAVASTRKGGL